MSVTLQQRAEIIMDHFHDHIRGTSVAARRPWSSPARVTTRCGSTASSSPIATPAGTTSTGRSSRSPANSRSPATPRKASWNGFGEKELPAKFAYTRADDPHAETNPKPEYRILVVADKYQTGFDQPLLTTMYVDKKLQNVARDPTRPYRRPLAPPPPAQQVAARATPTVLDSLSQVRQQALGLAEDGRFTQAAELLSRRFRDAPESPGELINVQLQLAHTLLLGGEYRRALPEFEALVVALTERDGPDDAEVLRCRVQVATCRAELGELTAAIAELNGVLGRRERLGAAAPRVLDLRRQVALLLASSGDLETAERVLEELHRDKERVLGAGHPEVGELSELLARVRARIHGGRN